MPGQAAAVPLRRRTPRAAAGLPRRPAPGVAPPPPRSPSTPPSVPSRRRARPRGPCAGRPRACAELGGDLGAGRVSWTGADPAAARRSAPAFPRISAARANAYKCIWEPRGQGEDASLPRHERKRQPGRRDGGLRSPAPAATGRTAPPARRGARAGGARPRGGRRGRQGMGPEDGDPGGLLPAPTPRAPAVTPPGPGCPGRTGGGCGVPAPRTKSGCARGWASLASARPFQALSRVSPLPLAFLDVPGPVQDPRVVLRPSEPGARQAAWLRGGLRGCVVPPGERLTREPVHP